MDTTELTAARGELLDVDPDFQIDKLLDVKCPRARLKLSDEELRKKLEEEYLTPSNVFSLEWLNKLQKRWDEPKDLISLMGLAPTMTRTVIRFTREGLEGKVTGYKEVTVPAQSITAKNSTSLLRKPAAKTEFVRGKSGYFPFTPGGLDAGAAYERAEDLEQTEAVIDAQIGEDGLLQVAPGFKRGLLLSKENDEETPDQMDEFKFGDIRPIRRGPSDNNAETNSENQKGVILSELDYIDDLLPVEFPMLAPRNSLTFSSKSPPKKKWAHVVHVNKEITNFRELVPNMAKTWSFELDIFQKEAVYHLEKGDSVFVAAHTSAGKTVVAEYATALAAKHMTKAIYTSPIKALSNQKFRDFKKTFGDVGILTGDVQINPEASCLIMTTEILRSMLYRGADLIRDVEFVIFDEVHYVNDQERGVVWEEVIIMLPEHINLILLSATVPNTEEFAEWVGRTKKKDIYVISTPKRPVPLEHFLWANKAMHKIVSADKKFLLEGWKAANEALQPKKKDAAPQRNQVAQRGGNRDGLAQRGNTAQRGRGQPRANPHAGTFTRSGRGGIRTTAAQDKTIWVNLVNHLKKENLLPAVIFVFSKRRCEENADSLSNVDFCTQSEKSQIHMIIEKSITRLKAEDRNLPQIRRMRELLSRGLAVHHGGLLPIVKELVEILFAETLVKVLFATETFAMGLNLPTRTVVFSGTRKHDGRSFRDLLSGEYIQMAGRAGRRGLDSSGSVIIISPLDGPPPHPTLNNMILGQPTKLQSQFRLTYNMVLNLLRVEALKIEEMMKRSFSENTRQQLRPEHERMAQETEARLKKLVKEPCSLCDRDLHVCHKAMMSVKDRTTDLIESAITSLVGRGYLGIGALIVIQEETKTRTIGVLTSSFGESVRRLGPKHSLVEVVALKAQDEKKRPSDLIPFQFSSMINLPTLQEENVKLVNMKVPLRNIEHVTKTILKVPVTKANFGSEAMLGLQRQLLRLAQDWRHSEFAEVDWSRAKRDIWYQEKVEGRKNELKVAQSCVAIQCSDFWSHFAMRHEEYLLQEKIDNLRQQFSDENLAFLPDYDSRIAVLKELSFIDEECRVQLKGRVACEINTANELVLTELVLENVLSEYESDEICALLSAFIFQEKTDVLPTLTPRLEAGKKRIIETAKKVNSIQEKYQVALSSEIDDFEIARRFGLMEVVYEWAKGMPFSRITELTDVLEGSIVRTITRLDETCREVKSAARIIGDPSLFQKMERCQELIKRDVCHCASLYL